MELVVGLAVGDAFVYYARDWQANHRKIESENTIYDQIVIKQEVGIPTTLPYSWDEEW